MQQESVQEEPCAAESELYDVSAACLQLTAATIYTETHQSWALSFEYGFGASQYR